MRVVVVLAMLGCGRIGFDATDTTGDDPPAVVDLDLTHCTVPSPLVLTRSTPGSYFDASGVLRTAAANQPRCAFDGETGEPRGVLVEPASTNYFDLSRGDGAGFENMPQGWLAEHDTGVTANAVVTDSPTFLGYREVTITTSNSASGGLYYQIRIEIDVPSGGDYTMSIYARSDMPAGIEDWGFFGGFWSAGFQMQLGDAPTIRLPEVPGMAWKRYWFTFTAPPNTRIIQQWIGCSVHSNSGYRLMLAAPQLEPGHYPTSPIVTAGSIANRATDELVTSAAELLGPDAGTIVIDAALVSGPPDPRTLLALGDTAAVHTISYGSTDWVASRGGATIMVADTPRSFHRIGHRYDAQDSALSVDTTLVHGAGVTPVTGSTASFGTALDTRDALFGSISRIRTWPTALDDASLLRATN